MTTSDILEKRGPLFVQAAKFLQKGIRAGAINHERTRNTFTAVGEDRFNKAMTEVNRIYTDLNLVMPEQF